MKKLILIVILFINLPLYSQDLTPEQIYDKVSNCVVVIFSYDFNGKLSKQGSGVVLNDKNWVVTNYHVFAECEKLEVKHNNKVIKYTDIIGVDVEKDILILKIEDYTFPSISIGSSDNLKIGQRIYAIGSPLGLENSMSEGLISGLRNIDEKNKNYIQISASISPGSSGGAIVNSMGELIGISTMTLKGGQNLNFAIPVNDILSVTQGSFSDKKSIDANNYFYKGYNALEKENYKEAIKHFTKYLEAFPNDEVAYYNRGLAYSNLQDYSKSISDYTKAIKINPNYADAYNNRGLDYDGLEDYSKAITDYNKAIEINPDLVEAYSNLGRAYCNLKDYSKAIVYCTKAIEINPNYPDSYYYRGDAYYGLEEYSKAITEYSKAISINKNDSYAYYNRGNAYRILKDYSNAISDFTKVITLNPNLAEAYYRRGLAYFDLQDYYKAISNFSITIEINPDDAYAYSKRGIAYRNLMEYSKAISDFTKAIEIRSNDTEAYFYRGYAYYDSGNRNKACEDWRISYSLGGSRAKYAMDLYCK